MAAELLASDFNPVFLRFVLFAGANLAGVVLLHCRLAYFLGNSLHQGVSHPAAEGPSLLGSDLAGQRAALSARAIADQQSIQCRHQYRRFRWRLLYVRFA